MDKQNVLYLSTSLNTGGTERFLSQLVKNLASDYSFTVGYLKDKGAVGASLEASGVPVRRFDGIREIAAFIRDNRVQLLQTFLYRANILGRIAGRIARVPVLVSTQQAIDAWKKPWHRWADRFTARWCTTIVANAQATRNILIEREGIPGHKIQVIYNGIPPAPVPLTLHTDTLNPTVITVTRLHREKGVDRIPVLAAALQGVRFVIVGDGPERPSLERSIKKRGLEDRVILTGWKNDVGDLLRSAQLFLLPSREESFPQAILEAMAAGLPVVASEIGGVSELVEDGVTGALVRSQKINDFDRALTSLLSDPDKCRRFGAAGYQKSLHFTEQSMIARTHALYEQLLNESMA